MRARQVDGVITATARLDHGMLDEMAAAGLPIVLVNRRLEDGALLSATVDDREGACLVVAHLASLGHTAIAHLGGPQEVSTGHARYEGYAEAMAQAGLEVDGALVRFGRAFTESEGERLCRELPDSVAHPMAIVVGNDLMALGCYDVFAATGIVCPRDISVVGFNDMSFSERFNPP